MLGLTWCAIRFAEAQTTPENRAFAFLDEFSRRLAFAQRPLGFHPDQIATEQKAKPNSIKTADSIPPTQTSSPEPKKNRDVPTVNYHAQNLKIALSPKAIKTRLKHDVEFLADDQLEGRGTRTRGLKIASDFIAQEFRDAGLYTAWYGNSPFQEFRLLSATRKAAVQRVKFHRSEGEDFLLTPNVDFTSLLKTSTGTMTLSVVFAGYGITAPELGYDDYANIQVSGKAVVVLRQEPQQDQEDSVFNGAESSRYAPVFTKIQNAITHGAAAVILCDTTNMVDQFRADDPFSSELLKVEFSDNAFETSIPVIHCRRSLLDQYFQDHSASSLGEFEEQINEDLKPVSQPIEGFEIGFEVSKTRSGNPVRNVMASIEPNGLPPSRTIVVGAHYDHLGRDGWGSLAVGANGEIHNGADDNASGTAVMMEVARQLAAQRDQLKCRVLFIAFTAEELGLLGSKHYIRDPAVPLHETIAMVNLDMVGRLRDRVTIYGTGTAVEWPTLIESSTEKFELDFTSRSSGYGPSDHAVFYERGIPVLHFFTGFHPQYHRPADDSHLLNIEGMRQIAGCVTEIVSKLAKDDQHLSPGKSGGDSFFTGAGFSGALAQSTPKTPRFGVVLKELKDPESIEITRVLPSSVAEKAGLKVGDVVTTIGNEDVTSIEGLRSQILKQKLGEPVPVRVRRRSLELEIEVVF